MPNSTRGQASRWLWSAALCCSSAVQAYPVLQEMSLHSMLESTTLVLNTLNDYAVLNPDGISNGRGSIGPGAIRWSGRFDDSGWAYSGSGLFGGMALSMNYTGTLSGNWGTDIVLSILGSGSLGNGLSGQPLLMQGQSVWHYDAGVNDYLEMNFAQETKIGANSKHGWTRGKERVLCYVDGEPIGQAAVPKLIRVIAGEPILLLTGDAASGKRAAFNQGLAKNGNVGVDANDCTFLPINPTELTSVVSTGKKGSATVSTVVKSLLTDSREVAPPEPAAPIGNLLAPQNQGTVVTGDGRLFADDLSNSYRSDGLVNGQTFSGTTISVPEPASLWQVGLALLALSMTRRRPHVGHVG